MSREHVITILRRGSGRRDNGPVKRFGRPRYLARRLSGAFAPFFVSFWYLGLYPEVTDGSINFNNSDFDDWYWLRPNDIVMVVVLSGVDVNFTGSFERLTSGNCSVFWRRWKAGDATTVDFSMTPGDDNYAQVRLMILRGAASKGNPFTAVAKASGTGRIVTIPSVKVGPDELRIYTWYQGGAIPDTPLTMPEVPFVSQTSDVEYRDEFFSWVSSVTRVGPVGVIKYIRGVSAPEFYEGVLTESGPWTGVSLAVKPEKPLTRVLAGPHSDTIEYSGPNPEFKPLIIPDDIVVTYVVSDYSSIDIPEQFGDKWQQMDGFPVPNGAKYLHVYWKRWEDGDAWDIDYSTAGFMRLLTVARGARKRGNPFGTVASTIGGGRSIDGAEITAKKNELVFFAAVASTFQGGGANALGLIEPRGVTEFEIDADSVSLFFFNWQYRTSSGYAAGGPAGPFTANFNKDANHLWTVTFTVLK